MELLVRYSGGSSASAELWETSSEGQYLRLLRSGDAFIGKNGVGKNCEGDARTPLGVLHPLRAFGILPDPRTDGGVSSGLEYLPLARTTLACDSEGEFYNKVISVSRAEAAERGLTGEWMADYSPEYNYGLETDFNSLCEYPLGSAIFIHCKGNKLWTGGCIALDEDFMREIILCADTSFVIRVVR